MTSKNKAGGSGSLGEYEDWGQVSLYAKETSSVRYFKISP